jgi:ubiquinone/menaquinone biosynthesis C-methylase UbiE
MSNLYALLLHKLSKKIRKKQPKLKNDILSDEYHIDYALKKQYGTKLKYGFPYDIENKEIVEIGCGHGGISLFLAVNGAKHVTGIDLNTHDLDIAHKAKKIIEKRLNMEAIGLPVTFKEMNAYSLEFPENSVDLIIADNVFEHFMEPKKVMDECYRVLKPGGYLLVPTFNSIYSKHGPHLKYGLGIPWAYCIASEKTLIKAVKLNANEDATIYDAYPKLNIENEKLNKIRAYEDLNYITHRKFKQIAREANFKIKSFWVSPPFSNYFINNLMRPIINNKRVSSSMISDVLSKNAGALLVK